MPNRLYDISDVSLMVFSCFSSICCVWIIWILQAIGLDIFFYLLVSRLRFVLLVL